jgi:hypothetical protein
MVLSLVLRATLARWLVQLRESRLGGPVAAALLLPGSLTPLLVLVALVGPAGGGEAATAAAPVVEALRPAATEGSPPDPAPLPMPREVPLARAVPPREHRDGPCPVLIAHGEAPPMLEPRAEDDGRAQAAAIDEELGQLWAALDEARGSVEKARALASGERRDGWCVAPFVTSELREALLGNRWITAREAGEVESLLREARWLAELDPAVEPAERSREDVRFLVEGIAWYLGCAYDHARRELGQRRQQGFVDALAEPTPVGPPPPVVEAGPPLDRAKLRAYAELDGFEDLLAEWD